VATLALMGTATFAMGLLPTYESVGILAPILLTVLRFIQGFGAGAEIATTVVLLAEFAPKGKRGAMTSLVWAGAAVGSVFGSGAWILVQMLPREDLESWGWCSCPAPWLRWPPT
jgi:MFS family permease